MFIRRSLLSLLLPVSFMLSCSKDESGSDEPAVTPGIPVNPDEGSKTPTGFALDDFKTCASDFKTTIETYWYSFNDLNDGGQSTSLIVLGLPAGEGDPCSLKWSGSVTTDYQYGYAGIGMDLGLTSLLDAKVLLVKVRGDGANYRVKLPMKSQLENAEFNFYGIDMACGDGSANWKTVALDLSKAQQEQGWGKNVTLNLADVGKIQMQTKSQPIAAFSCEIGGLILQK